MRRRDKPLSKPRQPRRRYAWRRDGVGFDLYKSIYIEENGVRVRKQRYVAHLSRSALQELRRAHRGAALERAIAQWIEEHDR